MELETKELLDLSHTLAGEYLAGFQYPWQALDGIKELILTLGAALPPEEYAQPAPQVWVHKTAVVFPTAYLGAPCIIGPETEVRHCAFIRGSALVGAHCVVGNSVELKNVILFDNVQTPHYNYVGDSILGYKSHMGAGSITSTWSPRMAPNFFLPVSIRSAPFFTVTSVLSDFTLEVMEPAPIWLL